MPRDTKYHIYCNKSVLLEARAIVMSSFSGGHKRRESVQPYTQSSNNKNADLEAKLPK